MADPERPSGGRIQRARRRLVLAAVITAVVAPLGAGALVTDQLGAISTRWGDGHYPTGPVDDRLAVVELPPEAAGQWSRQQHADVIRAIADAGAVSIGYDVVFDQPREGDDVLADAIAGAGTVILAGVGRAQADPAGGELPVTGEVVLPLPELASAAAAVGNVDSVLSRFDAIVRDMPLVVEQPDRRLLPSLSLATVMLAEGLDPGAVTLRAGGGVSIGSRLVPTGPARLLAVNWALPDRNPPPDVVFPVDLVVAGEVDLTGRIVFVGVDDSLADARERVLALDRPATPVAPEGMPGVYAHANAANTMLTNLFRRNGDGAAAAALVAMVALVAFAGMSVRLSLVPALAAAVILGWAAVESIQFQLGLTLDILWPVLSVLLAATAVVGGRYVLEERERRRLAGLFRQYVPDRVADDLIASEQLAVAAEGQRLEVTVLFCDLRGFTATAATLPPADVRAMLEVYYDHCTRVIQDHDGTVMQFVGDEVFAVFGAPLAQPDHAQRALDAAIGMQAAAADINAVLAERGVSVAYGIGLNTGEVVAAHVGSKVHKQYAVVGQTVNVGARLCSKALPGGIVLSKWTRDALEVVPELEPLGPVQLKGVAEDPEPARVLL